MLMCGPEAVGLKDAIWTSIPGTRAGLLITRCDPTRMVLMYDPVGALVMYSNGSDIDVDFVDGGLVNCRGKLVDVDWPRAKRELMDSAGAIMERSK